MKDYDGSIVIRAELDTEEFNKEVKQLENQQISKGNSSQAQKKYLKQASAVTKETIKQKEATKDFVDETIEAKKEIAQVEEATKKTSSAFSGIGSLIGGLAIAGIVALMMEAGSQSESVKATIEQISLMVSNLISQLAQLLLPVVEEIVNFIYKSMVYIGVLLQDWFGIDVFSKRASDNLKAGVKSARALRKQLIGFDEMNILNKETGTTGALSGGGGGGSPNTPKPKTKTPQEIADEFAEEVDEAVDNINHDFATKAGNNVREWILDNIPGARFIDEKIVDPIRRLLYKTGLFEPAEETEKYLKFSNDMIKIVKDTSKKTDKFSKAFITSMKNTFKDYSISIKDGMVTITTETGQVFEMTENQYEELMKTLGLEAKNTGEVVNGAMKAIKTDILNINADVAQAVLDGNYKIKNGYVEIKTASGETVKYSIEQFKELQYQLYAVGNTADTTSDKLGAINNGAKKGADLAIQTINEVFANYNAPDVDVDVNQDSKEATDDITKTVNNYKTPTKTIKVNADTSQFEKALTNAAKNAAMTGVMVANNFKWDTTKKANGGIINVPKLAGGALINQPGRGVPLAIGGERGREGIIPMDNQSQMDLLGKAIAKWIRINLTNEVNLDGRQIARSVSEVMSDIQFASNGGVI